MQTLTLSPEQMESMRLHVEDRRPEEACGLLAGKGGHVQQVLPVTNQNHSAVSFRMDPLEQLRAFNWMDANGLDLVAIYHSHPAGPEAASPGNPAPSPTDIAEAAYPVVYIIWSRADGSWQAHAYSIQQGHGLEVELSIVRDQ